MVKASPSQHVPFENQAIVSTQLLKQLIFLAAIVLIAFSI